MVKTVPTTTQAAGRLGASRQHVADLADRAESRSWRAGSHRRFDRDDVAAYRTVLQRGKRRRIDELKLSDRRSLAFGLLLAKRLVVEPEVVRRRARATSTHCAACTRTAPWQSQVVASPPDTGHHGQPPPRHRVPVGNDSEIGAGQTGAVPAATGGGAWGSRYRRLKAA